MCPSVLNEGVRRPSRDISEAEPPRQARAQMRDVPVKGHHSRPPWPPEVPPSRPPAEYQGQTRSPTARTYAGGRVVGGVVPRGVDQTATVVSFLLSVTFACGVVIAVAHVVNQRFVAPVYDVAANLTAFGCAIAASVLLGHLIPAMLSGVAIVCWLVLARRTLRDRRRDR